MSGFSNLGLGELGAESKYIGNTGDFYSPKMGEDETNIFEGLKKTGVKYAADNWLKPAAQWLSKKIGIAPPIDKDYLAQQYGMYRSAPPIIPPSAPITPPSIPSKASITVNGVTPANDIDAELNSTLEPHKF